MRKIVVFGFLFSILLLIAGFSGCDRASQLLPPAAPPSEEITVGVVLPLTGRFSESFGVPMQRGLELALSEINESPPNGVKLVFVVEDDMSTTEGAVAAFDTLIHEKGVPVILGPASSTQTEAAFKVAQANRVVAISPISAARGLSAMGDFLFRVSLTTDVLVPAGIAVTQASLGYQRVATLYDEADLFATDGNAAVLEALAANGVEVLTTETFVGGDPDLSELLTRIQALDPDAVFVSTVPPDRLRVLTQRHELGFSVPFFARSLTGLDIASIGAAAEGTISFVGWSPTGDVPKNRTFLENYGAAYGSEPSQYAAASYATLHILAAAIATADSTDSTALRDALAGIHGLETLFGEFSFDANGDAVYAPQVVVVRDGRVVAFE